jgi:6-phosphogluconolactonase
MLRLMRNRCALPAPAAQRANLNFEALEERSVPASLAGGLLPPAGPAQTTVYVETNNPNPGQNAVLAFRRNAGDGGLSQIGSFATGGTGQLNVPKLVGPDDGDQQVQATRDGRFLYAVNEGSDSVAAFRIRRDGSLDRIGVFASGGDQPDSIGIAGNHLYVANRGNAAAGVPGTTAPSVTAFSINADGSLSAIANSTITFPVGAFATQVLISPNNRFAFVELATLEGAAQGNSIAPFRILDDGRLQLAPGGNASAGVNAPILLGAAAHPTLNIVYAGFTSAGKVGVFTYDETGRTTFVDDQPGTGAAPCWARVSKDGRFLYLANTATDSIGVFSLADPLRPLQIQEIPLAGPRSLTDQPGSPAANVFEIDLDPTGRSLYAVTQSTDPSFPQGNQLHTFTVNPNGTLTESAAPIIFDQRDVPSSAHPQGVEVVGGLAAGGSGLRGREAIIDQLFADIGHDEWAGQGGGPRARRVVG